MEQSLNVFNKGFNQDLAFDKIQEGVYLDALNMRIITDLGSSSGNLENIKGNLRFQAFPTVGEIYKITTANTLDTSQVFTVTVTVDGDTRIFNSISQSLSAISAAINADPVFIAAGVKAFAVEDTVFTSESVLYITRLDAGSIGVCTVTASGFTFVSTVYASAISTGLRIIGWTNMRDSIILLTTDSTSTSPSSLGQIWKLDYDQTSLTTTLQLLYNNYLNLSVAYPIANPGMILARYETPTIQNIYWTDNYNEPRVANIADPNLYAVLPESLTINSLVSPFIAIPQTVNQSGGALMPGLHSISFRLSKENGGETNWFLQSYPIRIVENDEVADSIVSWEWVSPAFEYRSTYDGWQPDEPTSKSITYKITNLDPNYTRVQIAHIYYKTAEADPTVNIVADEPIGLQDFFYTLTGLEGSPIPITKEELSSYNQSFSTVRSINTKDGYLFLGNVKLSSLDLDWDARAYRFNASQLSLLEGSRPWSIDASGGTPDWILVPEDIDAINKNDDPTSTANFLYQSDGVTLGGEGPNISYTFITESVVLDNHAPFTPGVASGVPYRDPKKGSKSYDINSLTPVLQTNPQGTSFLSYHSPQIAGALKGYMRDEVYPFAIVFYDKAGAPTWAKWIADIRMPHIYMPTTTNEYDRTLQFPTTDGFVNHNTNANVLGIQFTVNNLDTIADKVSGYSIVRMPRTAQDKTVLGQGQFLPALYDTAGANDTFLVHPAYTFADITAINLGGSEISEDIASFFSPEFAFVTKHVDRNYRSGDTLDIVGILTEDFNSIIMDWGGGSWNPVNDAAVTMSDGEITKNYTFGRDPLSITDNAVGAIRTPYAISAVHTTQPWLKGANPEFTIGTFPTEVKNHSSDGAGWTADGSMGDLTFTLQGAFTPFGSTTNDYTVNDLMTGTYDIYLANYKRSLITTPGTRFSSQYGGNTYSQRSKRKYITTHHYQPVDSTATSYTNDVYGGDTFIVIYDIYEKVYDPGTAGGAASKHHTRLFPVETCLNTELRYGVADIPVIPNKYFPDPDNYIPQAEYYLDPVDTFEDDTRIFPAQPLEQESTIYDCRIYNSSNPKVNGELFDAWRSFKSEDYFEADSQYGPISALINFKNTIYSFQDRAFGVFQVNEKSLIQDTTGSTLLLGNGGVGERLDYISTVIGSKSTFGFSISPVNLLFTDLLNKKLYTIGDETGAISDIHGAASILTKRLRGDILTGDNPYLNKGITATYDHKYNEHIITFKDSRSQTFAVSSSNLICESTFTNTTLGAAGTELVMDTLAVYSGDFPLGLETSNSLYDLNDTPTANFLEPNVWVIDQTGLAVTRRWEYDNVLGGMVIAGPGLPSNTLLWYNLPNTVLNGAYQVSFDVTASSGSLGTVEFMGQILGSGYTTGSYSFNVINTTPSDTLSIVFNSGTSFIGSITNVSVRQLAYDLGPGSCWTATGGVWTFQNNKATKTNDRAAGTIYQDISAYLTSFPKLLRVKFTISDYKSGTLTATVGDQYITATSADGTYQYDLTLTGAGLGRITFEADTSWLGSISNIEMYEITVTGEAWEDNFTLAFNNLTKSFTSRYSFTPDVYINDKTHIITPTDNSGSDVLYIHDEGEYGNFYDTIYQSEVSVVLNDKFPLEKVFDNLTLNTKAYSGDVGTNIAIITDERTTFDKFMVYNNYQNTGERLINSSTARFIKRKWNLSIGGNKLSATALNSLDFTSIEPKAFTERIKSNFAVANFVLLNLENKRLVFESLLTSYRINKTHG